MTRAGARRGVKIALRRRIRPRPGAVSAFERDGRRGLTVLERARGLRSVDVDGVYFGMDELEALTALELPGLRVEIASTAAAYEEIAVFRPVGAERAALATLHRTADDILILARRDGDDPFAPPVAQEGFADVATALRALPGFLRRRV